MMESRHGFQTKFEKLFEFIHVYLCQITFFQAEGRGEDPRRALLRPGDTQGRELEGERKYYFF